MAEYKKDCYWYEEEPDMSFFIPYCNYKKSTEPIASTDCENCQAYHSRFEPIKADTIRKMNDEELAEFLCTVRDSDIEPWCNVKNCDTQKTCHDCQIEWLRKKEETKWNP